MTPTDFHDVDAFCLAATVKGYLPADEDDEYFRHMLFRWRAWHALDDGELHDDAMEMLDWSGHEPDDAMILGLAERWGQELNGARTISFGGRGRRRKEEVEWVRFQLYRLTAFENPATVRGIYYRAVSEGWIPKTDKAYRLIQGQLLAMRRAGLLPWHWITDSSRIVRRRNRFKNMEEYAKWVQGNYRADYWAHSRVNIELWCEKDALAGVLIPVVVDEFGLELHISKGQSSASYVYEAARAIADDGRPTVVYILSDFDPGGFRIAGKVESEMREHLGDDYDLTVERIAVTPGQIRDWELPTREVKKSDKQATVFISRYGDISCELDAIAPNQLRALVREHLENHMNPGQLRALKLAEQQEREGLAQLDDLLKGKS